MKNQNNSSKSIKLNQQSLLGQKKFNQLSNTNTKKVQKQKNQKYPEEVPQKTNIIDSPIVNSKNFHADQPFEQSNKLKNQFIEKIDIQSQSKKSLQINQDNVQNLEIQLFDKSNLSQFSQFNLENSSLQNYFLKLHTHNTNFNKVDLYQKTIFRNLKQELQNGKLRISEKRSFSLRKKQKRYKEQEEIMKQKLQQKRQQAIMKIKQIQQKQIELKRKAISTHQRPLKRNSLNHITKITEQESKNQLKKAITEYKKFTSQLEKRQSQLQQQRQQQKLLQLQKQQQLFRIRRQSRKQQVKGNLKQIMERQRIRKSIIQEWKNKQKQIKNKRYLYIEYRQKDKEEHEVQQIQRQKALQKIKNNHIFSKQQIQQHAQKYQQIMEQRRQLFKSLSASSVSQKNNTKKYQFTKLGKIAIQELEDIKKKQLQKVLKVKQNSFKDKIHKYQQKVNNQIIPNLKYKKFVPLPRCMSMDALEPVKQRQIGIKYLEKAKKLKKSEDQLKLSQMKKQSEQRLKISKSKNSYKDYLQQIKKDLKYDPSERKLEQILHQKSRTHSDYQSLKDAKYLSEYLVQKSKNTQEVKTMLAIQKKMDILNYIY